MEKIDTKKSHVYKRFSPNTDKIYIGSTTIGLQKRFGGHISSSNYETDGTSSKEIIKSGDAKIESLESFDDISAEDLVKKEFEYISLYKDTCCNKKKTQAQICTICDRTLLPRDYERHTKSKIHLLNTKIKKLNDLLKLRNDCGPEKEEIEKEENEKEEDKKKSLFIHCNICNLEISKRNISKHNKTKKHVLKSQITN